MLVRTIRMSWVLAARFAASLPPAAVSETSRSTDRSPSKRRPSKPAARVDHGRGRTEVRRAANKSGPVAIRPRTRRSKVSSIRIFVSCRERQVIHTVVVGG